MDGDAQTFDDHVGCSVETRHGADFVPREGHLAQKGSQIPSQDALYARLSRKSPEPRAGAESRAILVGKTEVPVQGSSEGHRAAKKSSSDSVLWMFKSESGWMPFSDGNNVYIESKYKSGVDCVVIYPYQIDLIRFVQTNLLTGTERCILRGDRNYLSISNGRSSRDLEALSSLMSIISFDALGVFKNLFNPHFEAGHSPRHASLQTVKKEVPAKTADGGLSGRSKIKIPKLPIGNCQAEKPTESPRSRVPFECPSLSPAGGRMARSQAGSGSNVKGRCRCGSGSCSRMVQYDAASMGGGALSEDDEREDGRDRSDAPIRLGSPRSEGFVERPSSFYPPGELDDGEIEVYLHSILGSDLSSSSTKLNAESSLAPAPAAAPAAAQSNGCAGAQDGAESERLDRQLISSKTASGSKSLFFFTPHKYRKRVGIIVPRILSCRLNTKKATKGSESEANSKFVRFNCSFMSPDKSKHSLGGYIGTPRRTSPKAGKESRSGRRGVVTRATETASDGPEPRSPEPERPSGASSQAPRDSTATSTVQTDSLKAFSVRSAFIVLNEDSIPFDISDDCGPSPLFGELEGGYGYERGEEGGGGYLSTLSAWSRAGRVQSEFFETMSEREFNSRRMSMTTLHDFDDEEAVSDTDARPPADKDSRRLISLEDFDGGAGGLRQISWWFNHSRAAPWSFDARLAGTEESGDRGSAAEQGRVPQDLRVLLHRAQQHHPHFPGGALHRPVHHPDLDILPFANTLSGASSVHLCVLTDL
ncbi:putative WWE domain-containing protein [Cryptosporidium canis]|uniref:WWE domain-containing protein n=1 Tax=Cryptosporidium canis TaxID=195482 RepID=A0ABQ8PBX5_9CRYT|nr:putative WWE domain-containing protein [Cryptosporidium canis]